MDQVIIFNKSYKERYLEYTTALSNQDTLSGPQIKNAWAFHLEFTVDPSGWHAVWKIPRLTCEELKIAFPTMVLVYVESVYYQELEATVKIIAVQDDIHLPSKHQVQLIHLWPTRDQESGNNLDVSSTANSLDMLRFFYTNIFMPWDLEEEKTEGWLSQHLESRLSLYYDMRNGTVPKAMAEHLKCLLTEAHRLQARREQIENEIEEEENRSPKAQNNHVQSLLSVHVRMLQIRNEVQLLEVPMFRDTLMQSQKELQPARVGNQPENWLVFDEGKIEEYVAILNKVKAHLNNEDNVSFVSPLALALENANASDTVFLSKGKHALGAMGGLQEGGILKGLCAKEDTIIATTNEDVMFDCRGDLVVENLTIDVGSAQCGILVRCGSVTLKNCKVVGDGDLSTHQGIVVIAGSKLSMVDCDITGFFTAIVGNANSEISLKNCAIFKVNVGLKIYDRCNLKAEDSHFHSCYDYGICVETDNLKGNKNRSGEFAVLEVVPGVVTQNLTSRSNGKGDAVINQKCKLGDLFSNPALDSTVIPNSNESSDEEMDENTSVIAANNLVNTVSQSNNELESLDQNAH